MRKLNFFAILFAMLLVSGNVWSNRVNLPQPKAYPYAIATSQQISSKKAAMVQMESNPTPEEAKVLVYKKHSEDAPLDMTIFSAFDSINKTSSITREDTMIIAMQDDVTFTSFPSSYGLTVATGKVVLLELNGHTLAANVSITSENALLLNLGTLIIDDNTAPLDGSGTAKSIGTGKISYITTTPSSQNNYASNAITNYGYLYIHGVLIENLSQNAGASFGIDSKSSRKYELGGEDKTYLEINGGKIYSYASAIRHHVDGVPIDGLPRIEENNVVINNGVVESQSVAIWTHISYFDENNDNYSASITFAGGKVIGGTDNYAYYDYSDRSKFSEMTYNISGTKFDGYVFFGYGSASGSAETINITGGTFNNGIYSYHQQQVFNISGGVINEEFVSYGGGGNSQFNISGGIFNGDVYSYCVNNDTYTITNGTFNGAVYALDASNATINISGGTIEGDTYSDAVYLFSKSAATNNCAINIGGDACINGNIVEYDGEGNTITISGGKFGLDVYKNNYATNSTIQISGGYFKSDHYSGDTPMEWTTHIASPYVKLGDGVTPWFGDYYYKVGRAQGFWLTTDPDDDSKAIWKDASDNIPTASDSVIVPENTTLSIHDGLTAIANSITASGTSAIIVENGGQLKIGGGGISIVDNTVGIIINGGGLMTIGAEGINGATPSIVVKSDVNGNGVLMFSPEVEDAQKLASVELYINHAKADGTGNIWQHVAAPCNGQNPFSVTNDRKATETTFKTYVEWWNTEKSQKEKWQSITSWGEMNHPWRGYVLSNNSSISGVTYTFDGHIVGNTNAELNFSSKGYNFFGNSYTAPIDIQTMLNEISTGKDIEMTVWIYNADADHLGYTESNNLMRLLGMADFDQISSMQGFWLRNISDESILAKTFSYKNAVWYNPRYTGNPVIYSPARQKANELDFTTAQITIVSDGKHQDKLALVQGSDFSDEFDNGSDASKLMDNQSFNIFASTTAGELSCVATNNLAGTMLSFKAAKAGVYTMSFTHLNGEQYAIYDMLTGITTNMTEGDNYTFTASAGTYDGRFMVSPVKGIGTHVGNVPSTKTANGVYSLLGQLITNTSDWGNLPAGVYVINGQKIVK